MSEPHFINSDALLQRFMGDQQFVREMLECFRTSVPDLVVSLHAHVAAADQPATLATVQKILNIATCSSAIAVQQCALLMEHAAKMGNLESLRNYMPLLDQMVSETAAAISNECQHTETFEDHNSTDTVT